MKEKVKRLHGEIQQRMDELVELWIKYVNQEGTVPMNGYNVGLNTGVVGPLSEMYYKDGDIVFVDMVGEETSLMNEGFSMETSRDLEFAVFGNN